MKFLYILVSNDSDIYYEQTLVSILSLKKFNPDACISLLVDDLTDKTLKDFRAEIKKIIQEYVVIPFDKSISGMMRSRLLKTNMRNLIEEDFLYLDGDTAIVAPLDLNFSCDLGAIVDLHARENDRYHVKHKRNNLHKQKMNFSLSFNDLFYNGGVIFAKDNEQARNFFSKWHELYKKCTEQNIYTDQLSLNEANHILQSIQELSGEWNCQVREAYNHLYRVKTIYPLLCKAKILHFFGSGIDGKVEPHPLMKKEFFVKIKEKQRIDDCDLEIIYNAKNYFIGAPKELNVNSRFPLFFIYRQFPRLLNFILKLKNIFGLKMHD